MTEQYLPTRAAQTTLDPRELGYPHIGWTLHRDGQPDVEITGGDWLREDHAPLPADTHWTISGREFNDQPIEVTLPLDTAIKVTPRPSEWSETAGLPDHVGWPQSETHTWGAFAGLAVELGGYSDIELVDPGTGSRFWFKPGAHLDPTSPTWFWDALIEAAQAAKATKWGQTPDSE